MRLSLLVPCFISTRIRTSSQRKEMPLSTTFLPTAPKMRRRSVNAVSSSCRDLVEEFKRAGCDMTIRNAENVSVMEAVTRNKSPTESELYGVCKKQSKEVRPFLHSWKRPTACLKSFSYSLHMWSTSHWLAPGSNFQIPLTEMCLLRGRWWLPL